MNLDNSFFQKDAAELAKSLLGKVLCKKINGTVQKIRIIETEAYYKSEKASHASLGYTNKRKALFMPAGTIYMYHSRGGDSLNIGAEGEGNSVLIKAGIAFLDNSETIIKTMAVNNPIINRKTGVERPRAKEFLASGQVLLCKCLQLKVAEWDAKRFQQGLFYIDDIGYSPENIGVGTRRGIPKGRDEGLMLRFFDVGFKKYLTK